MSNQSSSHPDPWLENIWSAMRAAYGAAFDRQWECPAGVDPHAHVADMKMMWGRQLAPFHQVPGAIGYALDNLPTWPPTLPEFRALCRQYRPSNYKKLAPATPKRVDPRFIEALAQLAKPIDDGLTERVRVAKSYVERFGGEGQKLSPFQKTFLDNARKLLARHESQLAADAAREAMFAGDRA